MDHTVTVPEVRSAKGERPLVMITAYDAPTARWGESAGADILLVGDSLAMVVLGHDSTLSVTLDEMLHHARAVMRASRRCLVVGDLPFGSYQTSVEQAVESGVRFLREAGVHAVKLEGLWPERVEALVRSGIPVMGHLGLTPQSVHSFGGYRVQGREVEDARALVAAARELEAAGCFSIVLEGVPAEVGEAVTAEVRIPTIGIGAGVGCDGQVLVVHDLLGLSQPPRPRFVAPYARLGDAAVTAISRWADDVRGRRVPTGEQSYHFKPRAAAAWRRRLIREA
ncbi:MAG: 3-methyl-2-oxobutanoate hydroxymethyltransferase [Acidobacteria bacterium]|nr:3-methyl-2-oxobutanoate hydroxymethyltransferase [Acidobacteriota bacterium]